jgi:molecular chaperone DnaK
MGGVATKLIEKNTTIPSSKSQVFSTAADGQTSVEIHITQGERALAADNKSLGRFILDGIPAAPRGLPQVEVTFDVDANGILNVKAKDKATNKEQSIRIEASSGLTDADIERMKKDAEANEASDKLKKEEIEIRNTADHAIYSAEKELKDNKEKIASSSPELISDLEAKVTALKTAKEGTDVASIKTATEEVSSALMKFGEAVMKAPQAQSDTSATHESSTSAENNSDTDAGPTVRDAETK